MAAGIKNDFWVASPETELVSLIEEQCRFSALNLQNGFECQKESGPGQGMSLSPMG